MRLRYTSIFSITNAGKLWQMAGVRQVTSHNSSRHQLNAQDAKHFSDKAWVHGKSCRQPLGVPG